jgi:hypothetical protein
MPTFTIERESRGGDAACQWSKMKKGIQGGGGGFIEEGRVGLEALAQAAPSGDVMHTARQRRSTVFLGRV